MSFNNKLAGEVDNRIVAQALRNFKASVDAWSDAAYSRPRTGVSMSVRRGGWRMAAGWALGCAMTMGVISGAAYERHRQQELAKIAANNAAARKAAEQRTVAAQAAANPADQDADLLATVDRDVSQQVPTAMEPLAQMMDDNGTK